MSRFPQVDSVAVYWLLSPANFLFCAIVIFCLDWLAAITWRKASQAHWAERARLLAPVRSASGLNLFLLPIVLSLTEGAALNAAVPGEAVLLVPALLGAILGTAPLQFKIYPRLTFRSWFRLVTVLWTLRAGFGGSWRYRRRSCQSNWVWRR